MEPEPHHLTVKEKFVGPFYMVTATLMITLMSTFMKFTWSNGSTFITTMVWRNIGHFLINYAILSQHSELHFGDLSGHNWNMGFLRGILSAVTSTMNNLGVFYLTLGESFAIRETRPLLNVVINSYFFKEKLKYIDILLVLTAISGTLMILQPPVIFGEDVEPFTRSKTLGTIIQFSANFTGSLADMSLKKIGKSMHTLFVIHIMGITNILWFGIAYFVLDTPKVETGSCYWYLIMVAASSFLVHWFYSRAYQVGDMVLTSLFEFSQCILGMVFDVFVLGKTYNWLSYVGVIVLSVSLMSASFVKRHKNKHQ